ncbi:cytochrome c peroxidase [Rhodoferax sp. GW822-FHT02A01]|uniref:cytochrome-c peroxidase n=1 Tax=Rhodoferax sp. GW822-FHT02A01 TaxID=3141537 RepID=UPI00315D9E9E
MQVHVLCRFLRCSAARVVTPTLPIALLCSVWLTACNPATPALSAPAHAASAPAPQRSFYETAFERRPSAKELAELGKALFFDTALSASGKMSCASCHSPQHAYGPPNALPVQLGGPALRTPGLRAVPSLTYRQQTPPFNEHFSDNDGNDSEDQGPTGGSTWDGRVSSVHEQAQLPLLSPLEMANADSASVVRQLQQSASARRMRETFGPHVLDTPDKAWNGLLWALEVFQQNPEDFYPYNSKYDAFLRGQTQLSQQELRGMRAFNDPEKGNCASCHVSAVKRGAFPDFTDFGLIALGVPRNNRIAANANKDWYDMGLCGPIRTDLTDHKDYCGRFKTPSLRNVAIRKSFFHNGVFHTLEEAVAFYVERDTRPEKYYPRNSKGEVQRFDDLPNDLQIAINTDAPFGGKRGDKPALNAAEVRDVVAFLRTLTDGYKPPANSH